VTPARDQFSLLDVPQRFAPVLIAVTDAGGATAEELFYVTVRPVDDPPTLRIIDPFDGATLSAPTHVLIKTEASDIDDRVAKVEFFADGLSLGFVTNSPYDFLWTNATATNHTSGPRDR
jgi:chitinase